MLTVYVNGSPVEGAASVRFTTTQRGSGTASWQMDQQWLDALRWAVDRRVHIRSSGALLWAGHLAEVAPGGECHAEGIPVLADSTPALDGSNQPTTGDATAINAAVARGALDGWQPGHDPMDGGLGRAVESGMTIGDLLTRMAGERGVEWAVTPDGVPYTYPITPGEPDWHVTVPGYRYGYDTTDLVTHAFGYHGPPEARTTTVEALDSNPGGLRREAWVDFTDPPMIYLDSLVRAWLRSGMLQQGKATPAPTTPITLGRGELRTPGGTVTPGWLIKGGDTIRVWGATDGRSGSRYRDFRVAETDYSDDDQAVSVTLAGSKPRGFAAAIEPYTQQSR